MTEPYNHLKKLLRNASEEAITDIAQLAQIADSVCTGDKYTTDINLGAQRLGLILIKMADSEPIKEIRNVNKRKTKQGNS